MTDDEKDQLRDIDQVLEGIKIRSMIVLNNPSVARDMANQNVEVVDHLSFKLKNIYDPRQEKHA